ncbi:MAG: hypothetical protein JJU33_00855 [Phycisphaerales bacterium]|nr:hypothetical protein [Phycisphaerales bacterium]
MSRVAPSSAGRVGADARASVALVAAWRVRGDCLRALGVPIAECVSTAKLVVRCEAEREGGCGCGAQVVVQIGAEVEAGGETRAIDPALLGLNGHARLTETDDGALHITDPTGFAMTIGRDGADGSACGACGDLSGLVYVRLPLLERCGGGRYQLIGGWVEEGGAAD